MSQLVGQLRCPLCFSILKKDHQTITCSQKHKFAIKSGIPILIDYSDLPIHSKNQQSYFDRQKNAHIIDSSKNMDYWKMRYLQRFSENFKEIKNKSVIEVGVGSGYMAIDLAKRGAKVTACDITLKNLIALYDFAENVGLENNLSLVCCSADRLPFKDSSFDYFILNSVLEHIPRETEAIDEIGRVLKKRGGLMITVPVKYKYIFPPLLPINLFHDRRIGHLRRYDDLSLRKKFPNFKVSKMYFSGHPLKVLKVVINMIVKIFDEYKIEEEDAKLDGIKKWSSNLIAFFIKK